MVAEVVTGLAALKSAFDLTKGLKDVDDRVRINDVRMELQEKILDAQQAQAALLEKVDELEKQIASFNQWEVEKENYKLVAVAADTFAYERKTTNDGSPHHLICANCYEAREKRIQQRVDMAHIHCPKCRLRLGVDSEERKKFTRRYLGRAADGPSYPPLEIIAFRSRMSSRYFR